MTTTSSCIRRRNLINLIAAAAVFILLCSAAGAETPVSTPVPPQDTPGIIRSDSTPPAPPPANALTAPSNKAPAPKTPLISAPGEAKPAGSAPIKTGPAASTPAAAGPIISAPSAATAAPSGVISAPSGTAPAGSAPAITAPAAATAASSDPGLSVKQSLFHDLNMKNIKAKRDYNIKIDISHIEELCIKQSSSVAECRKAVDEMADRIDGKVKDAEVIRSQQESLKLQQESNELQAERNKIEQEKPDVLVIERGRRHHRDREYGTGTGTGTVITESAGFGASGTLIGPNGSVSVQGGAGSTATHYSGNDGTPPRPVTISPPGPFAEPRKPSPLPTPRR